MTGEKKSDEWWYIPPISESEKTVDNKQLNFNYSDNDLSKLPFILNPEEQIKFQIPIQYSGEKITFQTSGMGAGLFGIGPAFTNSFRR